MGDVERYEGEGELRLCRDTSYVNPTRNGAKGIFTLRGLRTFVNEAEMEGLPDHSQLWFAYRDGFSHDPLSVQRMYFKTKGNFEYRDAPQKEPVPYGFPYSVVLCMTIFGMIVGFVAAVVLFGG